MTTSSPAPARTRVAIIGAGPAGLLLGHLLGRHGIDSVILESRDRSYVERRQRAGILEQGTVDVLRAGGAGERMDREGLRHDGIELRFDGRAHRIDFPALTGGRSVMVYAQTEVVKDLIALRSETGAPLLFEPRSWPSRAPTPPPRRSATATRAASTPWPATSSRPATGSTGSAAAPCPPHASSNAPTPSPGWASWPTCRPPATSSSTPTTPAGSPCTACGPRR